MNKKLLLTTIMVSLLFAGCGTVVTPANSVQQPNGQLSRVTSPSSQAVNQNSPTITPTSMAIDYSQYVKKTWIKNKDEKAQGNGMSFSISKIENGKITGELTVVGPPPSFANTVADLSGTVNRDEAECQFTDSRGNKGTIRMAFKPNDAMEATINLTDKSLVTKAQPPEGTFEFAPDNLKNKKGFVPIENQSFTVNLNSWGIVKFVSGKFETGNHVPVGFYLTDKNGDILYEFNAALPYRVDVKAVSFQDVNKDGLKDIIIIVAGEDGVGPVATVYLQKANGSFTNDPKLDQEINVSGNNSDVKTITSYLSKKF